MRVQRLAAASLLGVLAVTGLVACRADPTVAAYVNDLRITEAEVDDVVVERMQPLAADGEAALAEAETQLDERVGSDDGFTAADADEQFATAQRQQAEQLGEWTIDTRNDVVAKRILLELGTAHAQAEGLELSPPPYQEVAEAYGLPPEAEYVRLSAEFFAVMQALQASLEPVPPTEADQREIYDDLVATQDLTESFEQVQPFLTVEQVGGATALRGLLVSMVDQADLHVNPRYQPAWEVPVPIGNVESRLAVPLTDSAVTEESS